MSSAVRPRQGAVSRRTNLDVRIPAITTGAPRRTTETGRNVSADRSPERETYHAAAAETRLATMNRPPKYSFAAYQSSSSPSVARVR